MTKARAPLSIELAIMRVAGELGFDGIEVAIGHKERVVRNMSDPDHVTEITLRDAIALDVAFRNAGGVGLPFLQCFQHQLQMDAAAAAADTRELAQRVAKGFKEHGEANAALVNVIAPGATPTDFAIARRELADGIAADQDTLALLDLETAQRRESG